MCLSRMECIIYGMIVWFAHWCGYWDRINGTLYSQYIKCTGNLMCSTWCNWCKMAVVAFKNTTTCFFILLCVFIYSLFPSRYVMWVGEHSGYVIPTGTAYQWLQRYLKGKPEFTSLLIYPCWWCWHVTVRVLTQYTDVHLHSWERYRSSAALSSSHQNVCIILLFVHNNIATNIL